MHDRDLSMITPFLIARLLLHSHWGKPLTNFIISHYLSDRYPLASGVGDCIDLECACM